jgi:hypothetical protein
MKLDSADTYPPPISRYVKLLRDMLQSPQGRPVILDSRFDHAVWFVAAHELHEQGLVKIGSPKAIGAFDNKGDGDARIVISVSWHAGTLVSDGDKACENRKTALGCSWLTEPELSRLRNEQPKGGDRALCPDCGASYEETPILTTPKNPCLTCGAPRPSPLPKPQDVREALRLARPYVAHHNDIKSFSTHTSEVLAKIDAALAQSDAQPVGWRNALRSVRAFIENAVFNVPSKKRTDAILSEIDGVLKDPSPPPLRLCGYCKTWNSRPCGEQCYLQATDPTQESLFSTAPLRPDARIERMVSHCCVPEIDEPFFVLLGRDPQAPGLVEQWATDRKQAEPEAVDKWASAAHTACDMRNWKMAHPERGMSMEAFAKIAPPRPDASGLIEAAEWPFGYQDTFNLIGAAVASTNPRASAISISVKAFEEAFKTLRSRAADNSAPRSDKGGA